ncbi:Phox and Bem1p domain protein [Ceratobasidium sp. AG-Ba]|nr:Phox and Bem1p domain protein [Ceratobasidium sp. AG-Ba]
MATIKLTWNGMTRRALFPDEHPSWTDLSHRVEAMFKIPASSVSLSYVDSDGDTMFISSNDELFDFFHTERSQTDGKPVHRFTVFDQRQNRSPGDDFEHVPPSTHPDEEEAESSSASSASSSDVEVPNLGERRPSRGTGIGGMGIGFAPFEMMFGPAASAANVKSPSQGHISPVPTDIAAAEAGQSRSQFARTVSASSARSESTIGDHEGNPTIHIQQPSNDSMSEAEADPITPAATMHPMHPTPALYHDAANFVNALSGAVDAHPEVSNSLRYLIMNASSGAYWDAIPPPEEIHQASAHRLLDSIDSLLRTFFPPPPPSTPTQHTATASQYAPSQYTQSQYAQSQYAPTATPYTAAGFELPPSVRGDETPVPSRLHTPAQVPIPMTATSPAMTTTSIPTTVGGPAIRPVLDMARADRSSVRSDTDAGSIVSGMDSPSGGPAWRFAGRTGGVATPHAGGVGMMGGMSGGTWKHYPPHPALNTQTGAMIPMSQPDPRSTPEAAKYVESRVKLEHMKEMYKQTKEEYRREREERKRERERKKQERMIAAAPEPVVPPVPQGDMYDRLNQALNDVPGRVGMRSEPGRSGIIPPAAPSVAGTAITTDTAVRTRQQLNNWLTEQLADMGFSVTTHPQVGRLVRDATRPFAANAEAANENALLEDLLAQLVPTSSKA